MFEKYFADPNKKAQAVEATPELQSGEAVEKAKEIVFNLKDNVPGPNPHVESLCEEFAKLIGAEGLSMTSWWLRRMS